MTTIGYARLEHGTAEDPLPWLRQSRCSLIFTDTGGGRPNEGAGLVAALLSLGKGDVLLAPSLANVTCHYPQQVRIIDHLEDIGAFLRCAEEKVCTDSPEGKFILSVAGALTDHEYEDDSSGAFSAWCQLLDGEKAAERALLAAIAKEKKDTRKVRDNLDRLLRAQQEGYQASRESLVSRHGTAVEASNARIVQMQTERAAKRRQRSAMAEHLGLPV